MSLGGLTGSGGGSIAGTTQAPSQKQPDSTDLISYAHAGSSKTGSGKQGAGNDKPDRHTPMRNDSGLDAPSEEQSRKLQEFDAAQGRQGNVQIAQASVGTMTDAMPEMAGNAPGPDSSQIQLERHGQADSGMLDTAGDLAKKGVKTGGWMAVGGVLTMPDNADLGETLSIPGKPQFRIVGKETEVTRTLERENADGTWTKIADVQVASDQNGNTTLEGVWMDKGFKPVDLGDTKVPVVPFPADGPKLPKLPPSEDQSGKVDNGTLVTEDDGLRGADVLSTPIPEAEGPQILEARNTKLDGKLRQLGLPTEGEVTFDPGKRATVDTLMKDRGPKHGYLDGDKNEWNWNNQQNEWDVTLSPKGKRKLGHLSGTGTHINVSADGKITHPNPTK